MRLIRRNPVASGLTHRKIAPRPSSWRAWLLGLCVLWLTQGATAQTLETRTGELICGVVVGLDEFAVRVQVADPDGSTRQIPLASLTPLSRYGLHAARATDDAAGQRELAKICLELGLPTQALSALRRAAARSPNREVAASLDNWCEQLELRIARRMMEMSRAAERIDRLGLARLHAAWVARRLPSTEVGQRAAKRARKLRTNLLARALGKPQPKFNYAQAQRRISGMTQRALAAMGKSGDARDALSLLRVAWSQVGGVAAAPAGDGGFAIAREAVRERLVEAHLTLGKQCLTQGDTPTALWHAGEAHVLEPERGAGASLHEAAVARWLASGFPL